jgi:hypothetical protein
MAYERFPLNDNTIVFFLCPIFWSLFALISAKLRNLFENQATYTGVPCCRDWSRKLVSQFKVSPLQSWQVYET